MRSRLRSVFVLLLTVGLLAFFLRNADMAAVWAETRRANPVQLVLAIVATLSTYVLRAVRWQYLLAPIGPTRFSTAFRTTVIGFAASFLLPARAGEVIRPYLLARREQLSATAAFATIILERLLDLVIVLLLFAVFVFTGAAGVVAGDPGRLSRVTFGGTMAAGAAVLALAALFALAGHPERIGRLALRIEAVLPARLARAVARFVETFAQGLAVMRQPGRLAVALFLSFPLWLSICAGIWLTSRAFHIEYPFVASFLVLTILVVGVAVPTPGAVGGFHAAYQIAVQTFFSAPTDRAVGGAIVLHAISFVPVTLLGLAFMLAEGLTLDTARKLARDGSASGSGDRAPDVAPPVEGRAGAR
ncbi:MAG TPA: lysylphosphatidylglycerol synthase transmembrane domain-containing protein [Vicinamibacterales bacterium]|nr:lysylphosphatidylglycerol synthase transmembrane domain-containing protein [Vicinamibacterales bacterium]